MGQHIFNDEDTQVSRLPRCTVLFLLRGLSKFRGGGPGLTSHTCVSFFTGQCLGVERFDILELEYLDRLGMFTWSMQVFDPAISVMIHDKIPL